MGVLRRLFGLAIALVLLVQAGVGVAHGLRGLGPGHGLLVEICTLEGKRLVRLDADGQAQDVPADIGTGVCPVCAGLPAVLLPAAPALSEPVQFAASPAFALTGSALPATHARTPPFSARAPPARA